MNESSAGTSVSGSVASVAQPMTTERRIEEDDTDKNTPSVLEYGNWENSALTTSTKLKKQRSKAAKVVKSIYGEDLAAKKVAESKLKKKTKPIAESHLDEQDLIVNPAIKPRVMPGLIGKDASRVDHEVQMAKGDLLQAAKNAAEIFGMIKDRSEDQGLEGWVQEKITKAEDYLNSVKGYLESNQLSIESIDGNTPGTHMFASEGADQQGDAMAGLQRTIDFAKQHGYRVLRSPAGKTMKFINKAIDHTLVARVDNEGDSINVNFEDWNSGTSGNDDASYFDETFKEAYARALEDHKYRTSLDSYDNELNEQGVEEGIGNTNTATRNKNLPPLKMPAGKVKPATDALQRSLQRQQAMDDAAAKNEGIGDTVSRVVKSVKRGMAEADPMSSQQRASDRDEQWAMQQGAKNNGTRTSQQRGYTRTSQERGSDRDEQWAKQQGVTEGKDPTTDSAQDARGSHRGEVKKNKDGSYVATNQAGSRKIFKSEQAAKAHANSGQQGVAEGSEQVYNIVAVDKSNAMSKPTKLTVKAGSVEEVLERLAINDWYPLEINGVEVINGKRLKKGVAEGSISDLLSKDPTSPKFNDHSAPRKTKHYGSTPTPYEQGRLDAHRKKSYNNIHDSEQDAEDYKTGYRHVKSRQGVAEGQLDELSPSTLGSYAKKAKREADGYTKAYEKQWKDGYNGEKAQAYYDKAQKRKAGVDTAKDKITKKTEQGVAEGNATRVMPTPSTYMSGKGAARQVHESGGTAKVVNPHPVASAEYFSFKDAYRDELERLKSLSEARMSAALRMANAVDKQRAKSAASRARTPSSIPQAEPKTDDKTKKSDK